MHNTNGNMEGKVALVVGGTRGIGRATAGGLARMGAEVSIVGRNRDAGEAAAREISAAGGRAEFIPADVSLMSEVRRLSGEFRSRYDRLDVLVQSADVLLTKRVNTAEGIELGFATNYLSRFLMDNLLLDLMKASAPARIVHVAAPGLPGRLKTEKLPPPPGMGGIGAHNLGQRANDVFAVELSSRLRDTGVTINVINPGMIDTDIRRSAEGGPAMKLMMRAVELVFRRNTTTPEQFAREVIHLSTSPELEGASGGLFNSKGKPIRVRLAVSDPETRRKLWEASARVTGPYEKQNSASAPETSTPERGPA